MRYKPLSDRCSSCKLRRMGPPVLGEGEGRKLVIIGQAPGREERSQRRPFVGRAGQVLRGILRQLDLSPTDVRITNLVKCRPPDNREPTKAEIANCMPHLIEELEGCSRASLLLLGNTSIRALTDVRKGALSVRGEWHDSINGLKALLTVHPSFIARAGGDRWFGRFVHDIQRGLGGYVPPSDPEFVMITSLKDLKDYFSIAQREDPVLLAWDLETDGYRFYDSNILAMSLSHEVGSGWVVPEELVNDKEAQRFLVDKFRDPSIRWVSHGGRFDQVFTQRHFGAYPRSDGDTLLMHLAVDEMTGNHDLKLLARDFCNAIDWEAELWKYLPNREASYALAPREVLYKYAAFDVHYTLQLYHIFKQEMIEDNVEWVYENLLIPGNETMMQAEYDGIQVDLDMVDEWQIRLEDELEVQAVELDNAVSDLTKDRIDEILKEHVLTPAGFWSYEVPRKLRISWDKKKNMYYVKDPEMVDGLFRMYAHTMDWETLERLLCWRRKLIEDEFSAGSWQKVGTLCYEVLGLKFLKGRDVRALAKEYSTTTASLQPYAQDHEIIKMILGFRTTKKSKSTYVDGLVPDGDGKVHPRWRMHASVSGRLGCSDPNMMNQPHETGVRDFFIASPDHVLVQADYSQAELRIMGAYAVMDLKREEAERSFFARVYRDGRDLHDEATAILFGPDWRDEDAYAKRMLAKAFNFGLVYGRSVQSIANAFDMSLKEAQALVDRFFEGMPEVLEFIRQLESMVDEGELVNVFGRKRRFSYVDDWNSAELKRQARNFMAQSTASDLTLLSTIEISNWFKEIGWGRVLIFLHDSVTVEVPESAMNITAKKLDQIMTTLPCDWLGDVIPMKVDVGVGYAWGSLEDYEV